MSGRNEGTPGPEDLSRPIRDLGLTIEGSALAPIVAEFLEEVDRAGLGRVRPRLYLSTEWGVPDGTIAIAIPFYLARPDLTTLHAEKTGLVEGRSPADILRYLRHEMGHVVNYAYRLHERPEWTSLFGPISAPYVEEYQPVAFSREFVRHLPGWYAQKHPDEDWAETFAVWMTPESDWRSAYDAWPIAMDKLRYCDRTMNELVGVPPLVTADELDEDVSDIAYSLNDYHAIPPTSVDREGGWIDGALRSIFEDLGAPEGRAPDDSPRRPASDLIRRIERDVASEVFRWTGFFPERSRPILQRLAERADALGQVYPHEAESSAIIGVTALVAALASNPPGIDPHA